MPGPERRSLLASTIARALHLTRVFDWVYAAAYRARSELVAAWASEEMLDRFNDIVYASSPSYHPDAASFRAYLFPFEEEAIRDFFPKPPAHVLIGGAGGGREALALAALGYRITAFEPSPKLAAALAARAHNGASLAVYRARYEDLPRLEKTPGPGTVALDALPRIDGVIAGWGSFSHLRSRELRVAALEHLAGATDGPILVSFIGLFDDRKPPASALGRLRRALPRRHGRNPGDAFSISIGFYHRTNDREVDDLAAAAGLEIIHRSFDMRWNSPHVVLRRQS